MNVQQFSDWLDRRSQSPLSIPVDKPLIMGIVNVTPDSFSDGGQFLKKESACDQALRLIQQGVDIIDIGGETTKPGAQWVPEDVELARVIPAIEEIRSVSDVCISIDTYKAVVMEAAVAAGANIINDVYALRSEGALEVAAKLGVPICLMHMQGEPQNMQINPHYPQGVVTEIMDFFVERINACTQAGINPKKLILDPGFGFGKRVQDNLYLTNKLEQFTVLGMPLLLGFSRKSTIGAVLAKEVDQRMIGSIALAVFAALKGVGIIRTHDVDETNQALSMIEQIIQTER